MKILKERTLQSAKTQTPRSPQLFLNTVQIIVKSLSLSKTTYRVFSADEDREITHASLYSETLTREPFWKPPSSSH